MKVTHAKLKEFIERKEHKALLLELPVKVWQDYSEKTDIWLEKTFRDIEIDAFERGYISARDRYRERERLSEKR